jgi:hypothetical protein
MALFIDSLKPTNKVLKITSHMVFECLKIIKRGGLRAISPCAERVQIPPRPFQKFLRRVTSFSDGIPYALILPKSSFKVVYVGPQAIKMSILGFSSTVKID